MHLKYKNYITGLFLFSFIFLLNSCSFTIEKRRYRSGYHVDVVQHKKKNNNQKNETQFIENRSNAITYSRLHLVILKNIPKPTVNKTDLINPIKVSLPIKVYKRSSVSKSTYHFKKAQKLPRIKSVKSRNIASWILFGAGIALAIAYLVLALTFTFANLMTYVLLAMPAIGDFLAIIGTFVKFIGEKKQKDYVYNANRINQSFYYNLGALILAILGCIFSFLSNALLVWGFVFNIITIGLAIVGMASAFQNLKDDRGVKTILSIIFSFLMLILSAFGFLGVFKF